MRIPEPQTPRGRRRSRRGADRPAALATTVSTALFALTALSGGAAEPPAPPHLAEARELVQLVGVEGDLAELAREAGGVLLGSTAPAADREALAAIVAESFAPGLLGRRVARGVAARWDPAAAEAARAWLRTPQARGILARGRAAEAGAACTVDEGPPSQASAERRALLRRVAEHVASRERARRRAARLQVAMLEAANDALPASRRLSDAALTRLERAARAPGGAPARVPDAALRCHFRDVTSAALARAEAFFTSPAGRWAVESVETALDDALRRAARTVAGRVVERFGPPPAAPDRTARGPGLPGRTGAASG